MTCRRLDDSPGEGGAGPRLGKCRRRSLLEDDRERRHIVLRSPAKRFQECRPEHGDFPRDSEDFLQVSLTFPEIYHESSDFPPAERHSHPDPDSDIAPKVVGNRIPEAAIDREGRYCRDDQCCVGRDQKSR